MLDLPLDRFCGFVRRISAAAWFAGHGHVPRPVPCWTLHALRECVEGLPGRIVDRHLQRIAPYRRRGLPAVNYAVEAAGERSRCGSVRHVATRFPSTSGTAKLLAIGAGAIAVTA